MTDKKNAGDGSNGLGANTSLDNQYEMAMYEEKIIALARKIWNALNEVDYDPMHPDFEYLNSPVKDRVVEFAAELITGTGEYQW